MEREELDRLERHAYADGDVRLAHLLAGAMNLVDHEIEAEVERTLENQASEIDGAVRDWLTKYKHLLTFDAQEELREILEGYV